MCGWRQAGAYYGQFCGQYTARRLASPGVAQSDPDSQLLLGVNDAAAAATMHLRGAAWAGPDSSSAFMAWVRWEVLQGRPVIIGTAPAQALGTSLKPRLYCIQSLYWLVINVFTVFYRPQAF